MKLSGQNHYARLRAALLASTMLVAAPVLIGLATDSARAQQYFNGPQTAPNSAINGGDGVWDNVTTNWTNANGTSSNPYDLTAATVTVFGASASSTPATGGIVTVDPGGIQLTSTVQFRATADNSIYSIQDGFLYLAAGGTTFDVASGSSPSAVISSTIAAVGPTDGLTKTGAGTLTLAGANFYIGATTISGGTLIAAHQTGGNIDALGFAGIGNVTLDGGTLKFAVDGLLTNAVTFNDNKTSILSAGAQTVTLGGFVTIGPNATAQFGLPGDTGTIALTGGGTADLTSAVVVAGGTVRDDGNASITSLTFSAASTTVNSGATLDFNDSFNQAIHNLAGNGSVVTGTVGGTTLDLYVDPASSSTFGGVISGPGTILVQAYTATGGTMIFTGDNTYTGGTIVCYCTTLQLGDGHTTGSILGDVTLGGTLIFNRSNTYTFNGVISDDGPDAGTVVQNGTGTTVLTAANSYSGGTRINAGVLEAAHATGGVIDAVGYGTVTLNGGTLRLNADGAEFANGVTFKGGTFSSPVTSTITAATGTTVTLTGSYFYQSNSIAQFGSTTDTGTIVYYNFGNNTVLGSRPTVVIAGGTLKGLTPTDPSDPLTYDTSFSLTQLLYAMRFVTVNAGATLDLSYQPGYLNNLSGAGLIKTGPTTSVLGTPQLSLTLDNHVTTTWAGVIDGDGTVSLSNNSFSPTATATMIFTGANTYTGGTYICSCSTLQLGDGNTTGSIVGDVFNGGSLVFNRSNTYVFAGTISDNGPEAGKVVQDGTGTTVFTADNTYTGGTFVNHGTLVIGDGNATGSIMGVITVNADGTFGINRSDTYLVPNSITGAGNFVQLGSGTTVFATNTFDYTGTTTISAGVLQIGNGAADGSIGPGNIINNATLAIDKSGTFALPNNISGTGVFNQIGPGTTVLTGTNTYSGATNVNTGTLAAGLANTFSPNSAFNVASSATLDLASFNQTTGSLAGAGIVKLGSATLTTGNDATSTTFSGAIGGAGNLIKIGAGTFTLSGVNAYTGTTTISAGTLAITTTGSITSNVTNNATFTNAGTVTGNVANNAAFTNTNAVIGNVTNSATFTNAGAVTGNVINNATFINTNAVVGTVTNSATFTTSGTITGNLVNNAGKTTNNGTITGSAIINSGLVSNNGIIGGPVTVNNGGTLGGNGTVGATTINNGGTLSPGNSIGLITVNGNLVFGAGSIYRVEVSPTTTDRTNVTGTATLGGTVDAVFGPGSFTANSYTILSAAGGRIGTFDALTTEGLPATLTASLSYTATDVMIVSLTSQIAPVVKTLAADTPNRRAVAAAQDLAFNTGLASITALYNLSLAQLPAALDQLSGEVHASTASVLVDESRYMRQAVLGRLQQAAYGGDTRLASLATGGPMAFQGGEQIDAALAYAKSPIVTKAPPMVAPKSDVTFWAQGFGAWGTFSTDGNATTVKRDLAGFISGVDTRVAGDGRLGLAAGYLSLRNVLDGRGTANVESGTVSAYGGWRFGAISLRAGGAYAWHTIDTDRTIVFPGFADRATARYDGGTAQVFGEVGYGIALGNVAVEPFAGGAWVRLTTDAAAERGGPAALNVAADSFEVGYSTLGIRAASVIPLANGMVLVPRASAAWQHAFDDVTPGAVLAFQINGTAFSITGVPIARDALLAEAGLDLHISRNVTLGISYVGQIANSVQDHAAKGKFTWSF